MTESLDLDVLEAEMGTPEQWIDVRLGKRVAALIAELRAARASIEAARAILAGIGGGAIIENMRDRVLAALGGQP